MIILIAWAVLSILAVCAALCPAYLTGMMVDGQCEAEEQSRACSICLKSDQYGQPSTGACQQCLAEHGNRD